MSMSTRMSTSQPRVWHIVAFTSRTHNQNQLLSYCLCTTGSWQAPTCRCCWVSSCCTAFLLLALCSCRAEALCSSASTAYTGNIILSSSTDYASLTNVLHHKLLQPSSCDVTCTQSLVSVMRMHNNRCTCRVWVRGAMIMGMSPQCDYTTCELC